MPLRIEPEVAENRIKFDGAAIQAEASNDKVGSTRRGAEREGPGGCPTQTLARRLSVLFLCVLLPSAECTHAQAPRLVVIPSAAETAEGNASVGFGSAGAQFVLQYLYRQTDITGLQPGDMITGLTLRLDGSKTEAWPTKDVTWETFNIKIGPGVSELGPTLADNFTASPTVARSGPLEMPAGSFPAPEESPKPFGMMIPFTTSHTYTGGDLLFEFRTISPNEVNFGNDAADSDQASGQGVFANGIDATTGGDPFPLNWVIQLQIGAPAALRFNPVSRGANGQLTISWTGIGVLEESEVVTGGWSRAANQTNPLTLTPAGGARFFRLKSQ
jgi:hypothetical protein